MVEMPFKDFNSEQQVALILLAAAIAGIILWRAF
jgi:hypothetical protein